MVGDVGSPGNYYIPDHTLAQLTVKELNKRVSQVSQPSLLLTVVLLIVYVDILCNVCVCFCLTKVPGS